MFKPASCKKISVRVNIFDGIIDRFKQSWLLRDIISNAWRDYDQIQIMTISSSSQYQKASDPVILCLKSDKLTKSSLKRES